MAVRIPSDTSYGLSQALVGVYPAPIVSTRNPTVADRGQLGQIWINRTTGIGFMLTRIAANANTWFATAAVASPLAAAATVTAGTGLIATTGGLTVVAGGADITGLVAITGALTASGGANITGNVVSGGSVQATTTVTAGGAITAGTGLTVTAGGATITAGGLTVTAGNATITAGTFLVAAGLTTLGAGLTLAGTVNINTASASPVHIARGGTGLLELGNIFGATSLHGLDIILKLGDAAGANEFSITDSAAAEVASINSNGDLYIAGPIELGAGGPQICTGAGAPAIGLVKPVGSIYIDTAGVTDATIYIRITGGTWEPLQHV
jgi:hypothetical protein